MAVDVTNYTCPACLGPLHFVGESGKLECDFCGASYEVKEVEQMMEEEEKKAKENFEKAEKEREQALKEGFGCENGMKSYTCKSCGAELVCDETTVATSCPYCGNPTIVPGQVGDLLKPDYILPFKLSQDQAKLALKNYYQGKKLLPRSFKDQNKIKEIKGVYVPFWLYDGKTSISALFEGTKSHTSRHGDMEVTETEHYDVNRAGNYEFEKVPVDASSKMPDAHMDAIEPFDYSELKPYSSAYLPGYLADKYDLESSECEDRVEERVKNTARDLVRNEVQGYDSVSLKDDHVTTKYTKCSYALLPTYLLSTKWNDENYLFAMNGQSGKLIGDLPIDKKKLLAWFFGILLSVFAVAGTFFAYFVSASVAKGYGIGFGIGFVFAILTCSRLLAEMKTARIATRASSYVTDKGLTLTFHSDKYTHTTRTERRIEQPSKK